MIWPFRLKPHKHVWDNFAPFKRRCACGREEWLFQSVIPRIDVSGLAWKDMTVTAWNKPLASAIRSPRYRRRDARP